MSKVPRNEEPLFRPEPKFLNLDGLNGTASIKVSLHGGSYNITIDDCCNKISLHEGYIENPENAFHKIDTIISELTDLKNEVREQLKNQKTTK